MLRFLILMLFLFSAYVEAIEVTQAEHCLVWGWAATSQFQRVRPTMGKRFSYLRTMIAWREDCARPLKVLSLKQLSLKNDSSDSVLSSCAKSIVLPSLKPYAVTVLGEVVPASEKKEWKDQIVRMVSHSQGRGSGQSSLSTMQN